MGRRIIKKINFLICSMLEIIFPKDNKCICCGVEDTEGLCLKCTKSIKKCDTNDISYGYYNGVLKDLILKFKFYKDFNAGEILLELIKKKVNNIPKDYVLTYIPIGHESEKVRGFNQCEYIAKKLGKALDRECIETLIKIKDTKAQKTLSKHERSKNIKGAFSIRKKELIKGKKFLLIDDVITTGATIEEGEKILKKYGAIEIKILTIAKSCI